MLELNELSAVYNEYTETKKIMNEKADIFSQFVISYFSKHNLPTTHDIDYCYNCQKFNDICDGDVMFIKNCYYIKSMVTSDYFVIQLSGNHIINSNHPYEIAIPIQYIKNPEGFEDWLAEMKDNWNNCKDYIKDNIFEHEKFVFEQAKKTYFTLKNKYHFE